MGQILEELPKKGQMLAKFFKVLACLKMSFFLFFHLNDNLAGYGIFLYYLEDIYPLFSKDPYYY